MCCYFLHCLIRTSPTGFSWGISAVEVIHSRIWTLQIVPCQELTHSFGLSVTLWSGSLREGDLLALKPCTGNPTSWGSEDPQKKQWSSSVPQGRCWLNIPFGSPGETWTKQWTFPSLPFLHSPVVLSFLFYSMVFNFLGKCFSDRFSIFFIMLVIICSREKSQIIKVGDYSEVGLEEHLCC